MVEFRFYEVGLNIVRYQFTRKSITGSENRYWSAARAPPATPLRRARNSYLEDGSVRDADIIAVYLDGGHTKRRSRMHAAFRSRA
jgi:hypothetical protein